MKEETWSLIERIFILYPSARGEPVPADEVDQMETSVGFKLPADYREFVQRYGGGIVGPYPIFGLRLAPEMGIGGYGLSNDSAINVSTWYREQKWDGVENWLIIANDHCTNPIGLDKDGRIWISDHDFDGIKLIATSFEEFLRKQCLKLSS